MHTVNLCTMRKTQIRGKKVQVYLSLLIVQHSGNFATCETAVIRRHTRNSLTSHCRVVGTDDSAAELRWSTRPSAATMIFNCIAHAPALYTAASISVLDIVR